MLYALGPITFEVAPVNITEADRTTEATLVDKPVIGRRPPVEFTGDGPEHMRFAVWLFPEKFGGLSSLDSLNAMRASGTPFPLARGDGKNCGWFMVERAHERSTYLGAKGVGRVIEVDLELKRADAPGAAGYMASILSLLG